LLREQAVGNLTAAVGEVFTVIQDDKRGVIGDPRGNGLGQVEAGGVPGPDRVRDRLRGHVVPGDRS